MSIDRLKDKNTSAVPPADGADARQALDRQRDAKGATSAHKAETPTPAAQQDADKVHTADAKDRWQAYAEREKDPIPVSVADLAKDAQAQAQAQKQTDDRQEQERVKVSDVLADIAIKNRQIKA